MRDVLIKWENKRSVRRRGPTKTALFEREGEGRGKETERFTGGNKKKREKFLKGF